LHMGLDRRLPKAAAKFFPTVTGVPLIVLLSRMATFSSREMVICGQRFRSAILCIFSIVHAYKKTGTRSRSEGSSYLVYETLQFQGALSIWLDKIYTRPWLAAELVFFLCRPRQLSVSRAS
jgi:hypothetical protein